MFLVCTAHFVLPMPPAMHYDSWLFRLSWFADKSGLLWKRSNSDKGDDHENGIYMVFAGRYAGIGRL